MIDLGERVRVIIDSGELEADSVVLALPVPVLRDLPIDPPSSALKETLADFAARLQSDTIFVASDADQLIGSIFCTPPISVWVVA